MVFLFLREELFSQAGRVRSANGGWLILLVIGTLGLAGQFFSNPCQGIKQ